jgi:hypothetical protein
MTQATDAKIRDLILCESPGIDPLRPEVRSLDKKFEEVKG